MSYKTDYYTEELYTGDVICISQIENSDMFSIELFPKNQNEESFNKAEYEVFCNLKDFKPFNNAYKFHSMLVEKGYKLAECNSLLIAVDNIIEREIIEK